MVYTELDAKRFLASADGRQLMRVRVERDSLAKTVLSLSSTSRAEEWIDQMVRQEYDSSARAQLIAHFSGNSQWTSCDRVEALYLLCKRVGELERKQLTTQPL